MYLRPAACAAPRPAPPSAPASLASRRLMTDTNPSFFSPAIAAGAVAPPHPTVASTREKFVMPATSAFFTWANAETDRTRTSVAAMDQGVLMAHIIALIGFRLRAPGFGPGHRRSLGNVVQQKGRRSGPERRTRNVNLNRT